MSSMGSNAPNSNGVKTFVPKISIILRKNIARKTSGGNVAASERYAKIPTEIDLKPYLGQDGGVQVVKSVREPAGMFSITLADKMLPQQMETLYALIEPMDCIEIRMARDVSVYTGMGLDHDMPIMLRGFVSTVRRGKIMTNNGPRRAIVVQGQDYGKILQIMQIRYLAGNVLGQDLLSSYKFFMKYGASAGASVDAGVFVEQIVTGCVTPFLNQMRSSGYGVNSPVLDIGVIDDRGSGTVSPFGTQEFAGGSVYDLFRQFCDIGAWNELFIRDAEDGPYLVYRPTPFRDINLKPIQSGSPADEITLRDEHVVSIDVERSDSNVGNYFWVNAPRYNMTDGNLMQMLVQAGGLMPPPFLTSYPNSSPNLYGIREIQADTQQGGRIDGLAQGPYQAGLESGISLVNEKRATLIANNQDNVVYEEGNMLLRGNEAVKAGMYINLASGPKGAVVSSYYGHQVIHTFNWGRNYLTSVMFDRGTGFIDRISSSNKSPYLAEMSTGGVYA